MARVEAEFDDACGRPNGRRQRGRQQRSRGVAIGLLVAGLALLGWPIVSQGAASADDQVQTIGQTGTVGPQTVTVTTGDNPAQTGRCGAAAKGHVVKFTDLNSSPASDAQPTFGSGVGGRMSFSLQTIGTHRTILINGLRKSATTYNAGTPIYVSSITVLKGNSGKTFTFERPVSNTTTDLGGAAPDSFWLDPNITSGVLNQVLVCAIDPAEAGVSTPDLTITKTQTNTGPFALNQTINYTITATNSGSLLFSPFTLTDPNAVISSCSFTTQNAAHGAGTDANLTDGYTTVLDPADTGDDGNATNAADVITCLASHKVSQADLDAAGTYVNTATGTGSYRNVGNVNGAPSTYTESAGVTSTLSRVGSITLAKTATTAGPFHIGDTIAYTVVATNNGTVTLKGVVISDPGANIGTCTLGGGATNVSGTFVMPPGATVSCAATKSVAAASLVNDTLTNVATVTANPPTGMPALNVSDDDVRAVLVQRSLSIVKSVTSVTGGPSATTYDSVGDVIDYGIVVTNTGQVALPAVTVIDPAVTLSCTPAVPAASLAVGASINCTGAHTVSQADLDAGSYTNTATADSGATEPVSDGATATAVQDRSLQLSKQVAGIDGGIDADGSFLFDGVGDVVHYSIVATNDGNVTLSGVAVADPSATGLDCSPADGNQTSVASLAPGASATCTATYTVTQGDLDAGHHLNAATAVSDRTGAVPAEVDVAADQHPTLGIHKSQASGPSPFVATGATLGYEILVTNTGNVTLNSITVTDPGAAGVDCSSAAGIQLGAATLAPGASFTCTASHVTTQADLDGGGYSNTATAVATDAPAVSDTVRTPATRNPGISVSKVVSDSPATVYDSVGDRIDYGVTVLNTGNVTVHGVAVTDPKADAVQCDQGATLAPGASLHCDAYHDVSQDDLDNGSYTNVATATVDELQEPASDEVTVELAATPLATIAKTYTGDIDQYTAVGDELTFEIVVTNAGNVTLHAPVVTDPAAVLACGAVPASLAPGASVTCTASHVVTQADLDHGSYTNTATVATEETEPVSDDVVVPALQLPELSLVKAASAGAPYTAAGQTVSFTLTVTNVGNVTLAGVVVSDANATGIDCNAAEPGAQDPVGLAVGEAVVCTADHIVTQDDMDAGEFDNTAIAEVPDDVFIDDTITVTGIQRPALSITKTVAAGSPYGAPGDQVTFTITVTDTGNTTLHAVAVADALAAGRLDCDPDTTGNQVDGFTLAPAGALTCTAVHVVSQDDVDNGSFVNTATATSDGTKPVSATATATASVETAGSLVVDKHVAASPAPPAGGYTVGSVITWTIEVTNNGNVTLTHMHVTDDLAVLGACVPAPDAGVTKLGAAALDAVVLGGSLAPGASFTCTATHTVTQADIDDGRYTNLATASGEGPNGDVENPADDIVAADDDTVTLPYDPSIVVVKTVTSPGPYVLNSTVAYSIVATNNGTVTLSDVGITEQAGVTLGACTPAVPVANLAPGATVTCTATHTVTKADLAAGTYRNVVSARGFANRLEQEVTDTDTVDQAMVVADLAIANSVSPDSPTSGQQLVYVLTVDNAGPSVATDLVVLDPLPVGVTLVSASGDGWVCTGTTTVRCTRASAAVGESLKEITIVVQSASALQGEVSNTATVTATQFDPIAGNNTASAVVTLTSVLGEVITDPPTTVAVLDANLPRTGAAGTGLMLRFGALLTAAGAVLLLVGRRRPVRRPIA